MKVLGWTILLICLFLCVSIGCGDDDDDDADAPQTDDDDDVSDDDDDNVDDDDDDAVNPFLNPDEPGPYKVGNTSLILEDSERNMSCGDGNRRLVAEVWYPAVDDVDQDTENTFYDFFLNQLDAAMEAYQEQGDLPEPPENYPTGSYRDAPINPDAPLMPMLFFSHGFSGARFQNYSMSAWLASHGYVVVSPDHTCNAMITPLPDGPVYFEIGNVIHTIEERIGDMKFLIDEFTTNTPEFFEGRVDIDRVGLFGHSFGGFTVSETIKSEPRAWGLVQLAAFGIPTIPDTLDQPSLYMVGQQDKWMFLATDWHNAYRNQMPLPKWELSFYDTGHFAFSDLCTFSPWLAEDGNGCGAENRMFSDEMFTNPTPEEMNNMASPYITAFFGWLFFDEDTLWDYLKGNHFPEKMDYYPQMN